MITIVVVFMSNQLGQDLKKNCIFNKSSSWFQIIIFFFTKYLIWRFEISQQRTRWEITNKSRNFRLDIILGLTSLKVEYVLQRTQTMLQVSPEYLNWKWWGPIININPIKAGNTLGGWWEADYSLISFWYRQTHFNLKKNNKTKNIFMTIQ